MIDELHAAYLLSFVQNDRFRTALRRYSDLGPIVDAADVQERSAELHAYLVARWDEVRGEVETLMRKWCDDLAIPASQRPDDLADRLIFVLDQEHHMINGDMDTVYDVVSKDYAAIETCPPEVAAEIRRILPWDIWATAFLVLTPDDPPGADSTTEAHKLWVICLRTGIWRLHRLVVDPDSIPPRGPAAADAIRAVLDLPPRNPSGKT